MAGQFELAAAYAELNLRDNKFNRGLDRVSRRLRQLKVHLQTAGRYATRFLFVAGGALAALIKLSGEQAQAEARLEAVLKATGHAAGFTADELKAMAAGLQKVTTFGDEATISAMAVQATFRNIGQQTFPAAIRAAQDMSTVLKQDLKSSVILISKALNDPIRGLTFLSRAGVTFSETQIEVIKSMAAVGDMAGAQSEILKELRMQFGGAAEAEAKTFIGKLKQMKNDVGDLAEEFGTALQPKMASALQTIIRMTSALQNMTVEQKENVAEWAIWSVKIAAIIALVAKLGGVGGGLSIIAIEFAKAQATGKTFGQVVYEDIKALTGLKDAVDKLEMGRIKGEPQGDLQNKLIAGEADTEGARREVEASQKGLTQAELKLKRARAASAKADAAVSRSRVGPMGSAVPAGVLQSIEKDKTDKALQNAETQHAVARNRARDALALQRRITAEAKKQEAASEAMVEADKERERISKAARAAGLPSLGAISEAQQQIKEGREKAAADAEKRRAMAAARGISAAGGAVGGIADIVGSEGGVAGAIGGMIAQLGKSIGGRIGAGGRIAGGAAGIGARAGRGGGERLGGMITTGSAGLRDVFQNLRRESEVKQNAEKIHREAQVKRQEQVDAIKELGDDIKKLAPGWV